MSADAESGSGGRRLLSKVVKFVKSPTTHWADLDRPAPDESDSESRLALKEMIERKRRNDFVRNREFDMLRKVRRRETLRGSDASAAAALSLYPSSQPVSVSERAHTLKKIDEIEAQMSTAWFQRQEGAVVGDAAPRHAYDQTDPLPLPMGGPAAGDRHQAFAPTLTLDQVVLAPAPPVSASRPLLGDVPEFNVEVVAAAKHDPDIEEAAIRFANGDAAGAQALLLELVADGGSRRDDVFTWLTLFDLYRCIGDQARFDDVAFEFAARFGRSAPQWAVVSQPAPEPASVAPAASSVLGAGLFHWTCPSTLSASVVLAARAALARHAPPWCIDWRYVKVIEGGALPALVELLRHWAEATGRFKFLGVERPLALLAERSPTDDRGVDTLWWDARLALLRLLGEMDEFELVALNFCVTYEVSPPAWQAPSSSVSAMDEEGQTVLPSQFASGELPMAESPEMLVRGADGVVIATLEGEYIGSAYAALRELAGHADATSFELNCRALLRVDFGAAGDVLNWSMEQQARGADVRFKQVNRLVATFFGVIGINDVARVLLRTD